MPPPLYFHTGGYFYRSCGRRFQTRILYPFAARLDCRSGRGIWRRAPVAVFCAVLGSDEENIFQCLKILGDFISMLDGYCRIVVV